MPGKGRILFYGYGNPGRQDDGLGIALIDRLEEWVNEEGIQGFQFDSNYQLNIEDAEALAESSTVVFADATVEDIESFIVSELEGSSESTFTTHSASPGYLLYLCEALFQKKPAAFLVHLKGYEWELKEGLTEKAAMNLEEAVRLFKEIIRSDNFDADLRNISKIIYEK